MRTKAPPHTFAWLLGLASGMGFCISSLAAPYELRIYSDDIPEAGETELEVIMSVAKPKVTQESPPGLVMQSLFEYGFGLGNGWSVGFELPVSRVQGHNTVEGLKAEVQYVAKHDKYVGGYWGIRGDLGYASSPYETLGGHSMEINPIIGYRWSAWHAVINPSVEIPLRGHASKTQFQPSAKIARRLSDTRHFGFEYFSGWGAVNALLPRRQRDESLYWVWDEKLSASHLNLGLGRPLNPNGGSVDQWIVKVGWTFDVD